MHPGLAHAAMLGLLALAVVSSFRAVGTLLVFGLLVAPPAAASLVARRLPTIMATAVVIGWLSVVIGLTISYHADTAASASVAGTAVAIFFVVLVVTEAVRLLRRRPAPAAGVLTRRRAQAQDEQVPMTSRRCAAARNPVPATARSRAASRLRSICGETVKSSTRPHVVQIRW